LQNRSRYIAVLGFFKVALTAILKNPKTAFLKYQIFNGQEGQTAATILDF